MYALDFVIKMNKISSLLIYKDKNTQIYKKETYVIKTGSFRKRPWKASGLSSVAVMCPKEGTMCPKEGTDSLDLGCGA